MGPRAASLVPYSQITRQSTPKGPDCAAPTALPALVPPWVPPPKQKVDHRTRTRRLLRSHDRAPDEVFSRVASSHWQDATN